jgi:hypothetical protein
MTEKTMKYFPDKTKLKLPVFFKTTVIPALVGIILGASAYGSIHTAKATDCAQPSVLLRLNSIYRDAALLNNQETTLFGQNAWLFAGLIMQKFENEYTHLFYKEAEE